jgi:transcriptional regulator with XRE-family HTH domain
MALKPQTRGSWDADQRQALGSKIREARQTRYRSQDAFADALKVAAPYISQIEAGKRIPSDELCTTMSRLLPDALDWAAIRMEAHRLRSPLGIATLLESTTTVTAEIAKDPAFQRLWLALEQTSLPKERRDTLIAGWLQEIKMIKERVGGGTDEPRRKSDVRKLVRGSR